VSAVATLERGAAPRTPGRASARAAAADGRVAVSLTAAGVALLPLLRPAGPANIAPVDVVLAAAIGAGALWAARTRMRCRFPYGPAVAVFVVGGIVGGLTGPVPGNGVVAVVQDAILLAWCWTVVNVASRPERLRVLVAAWAYSALAWGALLFLGLLAHASFITGQTAREGSRTALTMVDPNYAASYMVIALMVMWATGIPRHSFARRLGYLLLIAGILSTGSNSGIVSLIVGSATAGVVLTYARAGATAAVAVVAAFVIGLAGVSRAIDPTAIQQAAHASGIAFLRDGIGRSATSVDQRQMLLGESLRLYEKGGALGQGPVSTKVRLREKLAPFVKEAHDDYFAALIERGVIGLLGIVLLYGAVVTRLPALAGRRLAPGWAAVVVRPHALVGAVVGAAVAGAVYELLHVRHLWTLFALVAALHAWGRE
jgi:hypothetical protein